MRTPGARVAVLTTSDASWERTSGLMAHEFTRITRYQSVADLAQGERPDIVVMDRASLGDGALALRRLRQRWLTCTLIVCDANCERDCEQLLDIGADEVIGGGDPLLPARLRAVARRARTVNASMRIAIGDVVYDRESRRVWCADREVRLTRTEEALLDCLLWYAPRPASVAELTAFGWSRGEPNERSNLVHVYMGYLRRKLAGSRDVAIHTVRGVGYEFASRPDAVE